MLEWKRKFVIKQIESNEKQIEVQNLEKKVLIMQTDIERLENEK